MTLFRWVFALVDNAARRVIRAASTEAREVRMAEIRDTGRISAKWARVTPQRAEEYRDGVQNPRRDWARSAAAAQETHTLAMQRAATAKSFSKGVAAAGTPKWSERAARKGPGRFSEGVSLGEGDYSRGFEPYATVIKNTALPGRFPKGDPRNLERSRAISLALHARKAGSAT